MADYLNEEELYVYLVKRNCSQNLQFRTLNIKTHEVNSEQEVYICELFARTFPTWGFPGKEEDCTEGSTGH